ncbi:MAG: glycosyltransferase [Chloroflexi bacterium]|nr:glycosyltransferase [Chloroflexota bacterium]
MLSVHTCPLATLGGKETGGMNVYVRDLSRELGRRGHQVDVFTRAQDPHIVDVRSLGENARVVHLPAGPLAPYPKGQVYDHLPEFIRNVLNFAAQEGIRYDVIHSHYWLSGLVALELRQAWGVPIVQMFHTLGRIKNEAAQREEEREPELRIRSEHRIIAGVDGIVAASPREKEQMLELYGADPAKIRVVPGGVDLNLFRPVPHPEAKAFVDVLPEDKLILFVGRIEPVKGIETLIRAIALGTQKMPNWRGQMCVSIIGGNPNGEENLDEEIQRLSHLKESLQLGDLVTFLGARDQDSLPHYYSAAEVCVVPSHYESFGMVALEAMACGTPVIASRVGGLTFTVKDGQTGFLIPDGDARALCDRVQRLLDDPGLRQRMGQQARQVAQHYSWPLIAERILKLYHPALGAG